MDWLKNKRFVVALIAVFAVCIALGFYLGRRGVVPLDTAPQFYFHPDSVLGVKWSTAGKLEEFKRASRRADWAPAVDPMLVQSKLNLLASMPLGKMAAPFDGTVVIELEFGPKNIWHGLYKKNLFVWTTGAHAGEGFVVNEDTDLGRSLHALFEEGRFAFAARKWNWCTARPARVHWKGDDQQFDLFLEGPRWKYHGKGEKPRDANATFIEKWLGQHCDIVVDHFKDLELYALGWGSDADLRVDFATESQKLPLTLMRKKGFWVIEGKDQRAFISHDFDQAIESLRASITKE